ncbi:MAG: MgtC/SapB family protein [Acidimicrobiia bacterium]|nr:MgtC/SapB family protein [Acidimicrobiia bacterium]
MGELEVLARVGTGLLCGAVIGLERQWRQRGAGLRTNALVATGATLFVLLSVIWDDDQSPTRVAAQVVSGVGFLGAGVILRDGLNVRGINTAATLWCAAAVGTLAGAGEYLIAATGAVIVAAANLFLRPVARKIDRLPVDDTEVETTYRFRAVCRHAQEAHVRALLLQSLSGYRLKALDSADLDADRVTVNAEILVEGRPDERLEQAVSRLSLEPGISAVRWEVVPGDTLEEPYRNEGDPS